MAVHTPHPTLRQLICAGLCALTLAPLGGCEIQEPALPTFSTRIAIPIGTQDITVREMIDDQDFLFEGDDSQLFFGIDGDTIDVALDLAMDLDVDGIDVSTELGEFALDAVEPLAVGFTLADLYPAAAGFPPLAVPVPAFDFALDSAPQAVDGVDSAHVASGRLVVAIANGLPVPVSGVTPPLRLVAELLHPDTGELVTRVEFPAEIAAGGAATASTDLAGVLLPGVLVVRLSGGSPGAASVVVDPDASIALDVSLEELVVDEATARIGELSFEESGSAELPADYAITEATVGGGELRITLVSDIVLPCDVVVDFPEITQAGGEPLVLTLDLPAGGAETLVVDLAGARIAAPAGTSLSALHYLVTAVSPGSGDATVSIGSGDRLGASIAPLTLSLAEVRGTIPAETYVLDPVIETVDLPDELDGLHLTAASLIVEVFNGTGVGGEVDLVLTGENAAGETASLVTVAQIPAAERSATPRRTVIVLDETNSDIIALLDLLPETVRFSGEVRVGGAGEVGVIRPGESLQVCWGVEAPLRLSVESSEIDRNPEPLDLDENLRDDLDRRLVGATVVAELDNHFPFGVEILFLVGADSLSTLDDPELTIGPLAVAAGLVDAEKGFVVEATTSRHEIVLDHDQIGAFIRAGAHVAVVALIPGTDGRVVTLRTMDRLTVRGALSAEIVVGDE